MDRKKYFLQQYFYVAERPVFHTDFAAPDGAYSTAPGFGTARKMYLMRNVYYGVKALADDPHA